MEKFLESKGLDCIDRKGCYDEPTLTLVVREGVESIDNIPLMDGLIHEYVHHLVFITLKTPYLTIIKTFPYQNISYAWGIEGIAEYLSGKVLYKNGIPDGIINVLRKYKEGFGRQMTIWEILTTANDVVPNNPIRDYRHYWYASSLFQFLIEHGHQSNILESLERLYALNFGYSDSIVEIFSDNKFGSQEQLEAECQKYLLTLTH